MVSGRWIGLKCWIEIPNVGLKKIYIRFVGLTLLSSQKVLCAMKDVVQFW